MVNSRRLTGATSSAACPTKTLDDLTPSLAENIRYAATSELQPSTEPRDQASRHPGALHAFVVEAGANPPSRNLTCLSSWVSRGAAHWSSFSTLCGTAFARDSISIEAWARICHF